MSKEFDQDTEIGKLVEKDREIVLRAPVIVALLAAVSNDGVVSSSEKTEAIRLAHLRTYTSPEILHNFYKAVDNVFVNYFEEELGKLSGTKEEMENLLSERLKELDEVLPKMNQVYAKELVISLKSFSRHVFKVGSGFLEHFLLPIFLGRIERNFYDPKIGEQ